MSVNVRQPMWAKMTEDFTKYKELISYLFWGVLTTVVSWGTYGLFVMLLGYDSGGIRIFDISEDACVFISNILSWLCAVVFSFVTNKIWVFQSKSWELHIWLSELSAFVASRIATGGLEMVAVPIVVNLGLDAAVFGVSGMLAKIVVSLVVVILNYLLSKILIFRNKDQDTELK